MQSAVSMERSEQSHSYCIWWGRVGGPDRFRHWVLADSIDKAISRSRLDISRALGTNASLWKIEVPEHNPTRAVPTDVVSWPEGHGRSSQQVGIIAFALLMLGLSFLFHWKSGAVESVEPIEHGAASEIVTTEVPPESIPTVSSWDAFVRSIKNQ